MEDVYRWLEDGEVMQSGDEFAKALPRTDDPNDKCAEWTAIPPHNIGKVFYSFEFKGTRRKIS